MKVEASTCPLLEESGYAGPITMTVVGNRVECAAKDGGFVSIHVVLTHAQLLELCRDALQVEELVRIRQQLHARALARFGRDVDRAASLQDLRSKGPSSST